MEWIKIIFSRCEKKEMKGLFDNYIFKVVWKIVFKILYKIKVCLRIWNIF